MGEHSAELQPRRSGSLKMTQRVNLAKDDWYPWITIEEGHGVAVEVSDTDAARWREGLAAARKLQAEMLAVYASASGEG